MAGKRGNYRRDPVTQAEVSSIREMISAGVGQAGIAVAMNRSQTFISRLLRSEGISTGPRRGVAHSMWKGGRFLTGEGYVKVWIPDDDPHASMRDSHGYVSEHRLVMARTLGRVLSRDETVHHIDGDKTRNAPENLQLRLGRHGKGGVYRCADCGSRHILCEEI